jgi:alpha-L-fucosidase 2
VVVDSLAWKDGKLTYLKLTSENNTPLHLEYAVDFSITTKSGSSYELDGNLKLLNQPFEAVVIPARIQAEDYVEMSGVEIETGSDNEVNIGWIKMAIGCLFLCVLLRQLHSNGVLASVLLQKKQVKLY